jgi:hypothetical protein
MKIVVNGHRVEYIHQEHNFFLKKGYKKNMKEKLLSVIKFFGDCSRSYCGHSIIYHVPISGCLKCRCEEYK